MSPFVPLVLVLVVLEWRKKGGSSVVRHEPWRKSYAKIIPLMIRAGGCQYETDCPKEAVTGSIPWVNGTLMLCFAVQPNTGY